MNDQIKDFVERNREEFDHLEAPAFDLAHFKRTLANQQQPEVKKVKLFNAAKWLIAASVLVAMASVWLFYQSEKKATITYVAQQPAKKTAKPEQKLAPADEKVNFAKQQLTQQNIKVEPVTKTVSSAASSNEVFKDLSDSSSASLRLLAILKIEKSNKVNNQVLDMLSQTLNHDGNTNVRLAALSVLQKYSSDKHASALLINALGSQKDPIVQLGLISLLGKMRDVKVDEKLYAIANNPETFEAVRDEAYNVLLNQDKL